MASSLKMSSLGTTSLLELEEWLVDNDTVVSKLDSTNATKVKDLMINFAGYIFKLYNNADRSTSAISSNMISVTSLTNDAIKNDIKNYLKGLDNYQEIKDNMPGSNMTIIVDLLAGWATYINYKNNLTRNETYLSTATLESSVYNIAYAFGYRINRYTAPILTVKYSGAHTIDLKCGDVVGTYKSDVDEYDLVYFGDDRRIENLDTFEVRVGRYVSFCSHSISVLYQKDSYGNILTDAKGNSLIGSRSISQSEFYNVLNSYDSNNQLQYYINPIYLTSVDNDCIRVTVNRDSDLDNTEVLPVTQDLEQYIVNNCIIDFSKSTTQLTLFISNADYSYGVHIGADDIVTLSYLETDGKISNFDLNLCSMVTTWAESSVWSGQEVDVKFIPIDIESYGTNGQSLQQIIDLTPFYYSTQRRMVTVNDHQYVAESLPYFKQVRAEKDVGVADIFKISFARLEDLSSFKFYINGKETSFNCTKYLVTAKSALDYFIEQLLKVDNIELISVDYKALELFVKNLDLSYSLDMEALSNVNISRQQVGELPRCCTVNLYYTHANIDDKTINPSGDPLLLSSVERKNAMNSLKHYKLVSERIVLISANKISKEVHFAIKLINPLYKNVVLEKLKEVLHHHEFKLEHAIDVTEITAELAKVEIPLTNAIIKPIEAIQLLDNPEDVNEDAHIDRYVKFENIDLTDEDDVDNNYVNLPFKFV